MSLNVSRWLFAWTTLLCLFSNVFAAAAQEDELLMPDQAFAFSAQAQSADRIQLQWQIADGYYLYRSRFQFRSDTPGIELGEAELPPGKIKDDEFFGKVETYRGTVTVNIPIKRQATAPEQLQLVAVSQGCADQGVCYPPHTQTAALDLPLAAANNQTSAPAASTSTASNKAPSALDKLVGLGRDLGFSNGDEFLDPDIAFQPTLSASADGSQLIARWQIAKGYYLYRDKFRFDLETGDGIRLLAPQLPPGDVKNDETFGRVEVYHNDVEIRVPLQRDNTAATAVQVKLSYQGCAEAGICYPPQHKVLPLELPAGSSADPSATTPSSGVTNRNTSAGADVALTEQDRIAGTLASGNTLITVLSFFGFGLLLAFTPCVFPMIPILSSIIIGQGEQITTRRAFSLSLVYVLAMALTYTGAGVMAGLSGENLQAAFQNPWILGSFAAVFVVLSLSMFGFYDLQMPAVLQSRLSEISNRQRGGSLLGVAVMGFLSALIVGPCVAAPLAGALIYIGQTGDPYLGGIALFALSMGMGAPLLAIGTGAGKLLPRAGGWMNAVKAVFGVLLLAVAIWMLERIIPTAVSMTLWAVLLITSAVYMGALDKLDVDATGWSKLSKGSGVILLVYGVLILAGVAAGGKDVLQPLRGVGLAATGGTVSSHLEFRTIKSVADLNREIALANSQGKGVMLDFYADWCTECHRMEKNTFSDAQVQAALGQVVALQADVTANDETDKALLQHFKLIGPPAILFFDTSGAELARHRVIGYMDAEQFERHVQRAYGKS